MAHTPGWNDPPPLSFSQSSQPSTKRTLLNKRVPYPFTQISPSLNTDASSNIPTTSPSIPSILGSTPPPSENVEEHSIDEPIPGVPEEEILLIVTGIFEKILSENSTNNELKKIEEINRRLDVMKKSWDKIGIPVKHKMLKLAQELSKGNAESAMKIQCVLMVDHLREVKQWMVGVKHIIEMERLKTSVAGEPINDIS